MGFISTVSGRIAPPDLGIALGAETLVTTGPERLAKIDIPAGDVAFAREPVSIEHLGRLAMGAQNLDDLRIDEAHAEAALHAFAAAGGRSIVALAGGSAAWDSELLRSLAGRTGVIIVRGALPGDLALEAEAEAEAGAEADSTATPHSSPAAGIVGRVALPPTVTVGGGADEAAVDSDSIAALDAAIAAAVASGLPLALDALSEHSIGDVELALERGEAMGLARSRVLVLGAANLIANTQSLVGTDPAKLEALIELGAVCAFDDLGRLPTVRTVVSDHDVAMAVLAFAQAGAADRVVLSSGITQKHRLAAFGGNGLEFVPQQFAPYLQNFGADEALIRAVSGASLAALLTRVEPQPPVGKDI